MPAHPKDNLTTSGIAGFLFLCYYNRNLHRKGILYGTSKHSQNHPFLLV